MTSLRGKHTSIIEQISKTLLAFCVALLTHFAVPKLAHAGEQAHRQLAIKLERAPETPHDTLTLKATITNISKHDVTIVLENPLADYVVVVKDLRGKTMPLSDYGKQIRSRTHISTSRSLMVTLHPGEQNTETWAVDKMFELVRPASYRVLATRDFPALRESDSSNTLEVTLD